MIFLSRETKPVKFNLSALLNVICVLCIIGSIGCIIMLNVTSSAYHSEYDANEVTISDLQQELKSLQSQTSVTDDEVTDVLYSATEAGNAVASAQTEYGGLDMSADDYAQQRDEIKNSITQYFADEDSGYASQWYFSSEVSFEWRFLSTYSFDTQTIDVIWGCYDSDGNVLAICTGVYDVNTGLFSQCDPVETDYGFSVIVGQQEETTVDMDRINDLMEQMQ